MTNLSGPPKKQWLSRERVLIATPLTVGALAAVAIVGLVVRPSQIRVGEMRERLMSLQGLEQTLPTLERQIAQAELEQLQAQEQQMLLVDLIADSEHIQTALALLDREAIATGVTLMMFEPAAEPQPAPASRSKRQRQREAPTNDDDAEAKKDPLEALGYRKTSMVLRVMGPYGALQEFLQQVESQQVLMEGSDLELETVELSRREDSDGSVTVINGTELGLKLSFYDRMPFTPSQSETQEDPDRIDAPS